MKVSRLRRLLAYLEETIEYLSKKVEGVDRDRYIADRDMKTNWQNIVIVKERIPSIKEFMNRVESLN